MADYDLMIDKINHALSTWETVKGAHGLSPEIIEQGNEILKEAKNAAAGN